MLAKLLYIIQSTKFKIFTHIYTNVTFDDSYIGF